MDDNDIVYTHFSPNFLGFFNRMSEIVTGQELGSNGFIQFLSTVWDIWSIIAFVLSALFIYGIIYSYLRLNKLQEKESQELYNEEQLWKNLNNDSQENRRWNEIQSHISSDNPNDWKLAIIEADIILGEVLENVGYAGHSIGDQLKGAKSANFTTIQDAWDAHLIRNKIAHSSDDFVLTHSVAKEAMIKYKRVFKEFDAI